LEETQRQQKPPRGARLREEAVHTPRLEARQSALPARSGSPNSDEKETGKLMELVVSQSGVPQGGPLSPLLSNIMLDVLDKELERRGHRFCRYADDCNIYVQSERAGERVYDTVTAFIETRSALQKRLNQGTDRNAESLPTRMAGILCHRRNAERI
jgi:hypothetical protein